ncbi:hypothetical protein [Mucilaginibacter sp. UR6-11]|uniref:hypothetical protein n=1 Tax=Mucilaginibacter sp. UR6-11 TaxID=1435644 RepID=UPI001E44CFCA|nr:hypothetical protein [Mucilaginibacter sp. UR6-11]MCC8424624.1 hypothetical protein [Mucilaginibacter sp. UR6-11]
MTAIAKKIFSYFLKAAILVLAFTFIYHQYLTKGDNLKQFELAVNRLSHTQVTVVMSVVVLLMFANWLVECLKWQHLTRKLSPISLWKSIEGVFCGLTWAIFTPNRIGEYGGRVMFLPPRKRIHGVFAMAVGSFGQNVITNVLGAAALIWFCFTFLHLNVWAYIGISLLGIVFMTLFLVFYFNIKWLVWLLNSVAFLKKYHRFFDIMGTYKFKDLVNIMCFCLTRFFIFSFQYYLVIHLLIPEIPFVDVILMVFIVFFIQSALPSLDLLDVPVRATASATLFAFVTHQQIAIIAAFTSIWLINLIIPAILGSVFIFKLKFFDRNL